MLLVTSPILKHVKWFRALARFGRAADALHLPFNGCYNGLRNLHLLLMLHHQ